MRLRELESELQHWRSAGEQAQLWWRDDDAVTATAQLQRLTQLTGEAGIEVLLASIPAYADRQLADHVAQHQTLKPCVHGWAHANHAPASEKKCELGPHRAIEVVLSDIVRGKQRLEQLFGGDLVPVLVPPWNRMRDDLAPRLSAIGIKAFSTFGHERAFPAIQVNSHVDVMDWKSPGGAAGKSGDQLYAEVAAALAVSRSNGCYPVGLLTHHLVHDETVWAALGDIVACSGLRWVSFEHALDH